VQLIVNRVRADMIKKNDMMSVKDVQANPQSQTSYPEPRPL